MTTNVFTRFKRLFPGDPTRIGTVVSVDGTAAVVEELGGARSRVTGSATVGQKVYFRGSVIDGPAPNLTQEVIEE